MSGTVYLETSVISYLAAWPSRDLVTAGHQQLTHEWWRLHRSEFDLYVSQAVINEARLGDPDAASRRLAILDEIPILEETDEAKALAHEIMRRVPLPPRAAVDALHIAMAVVNGVDYLLTWNCAHIANATLRVQVEATCREEGYEPPVICTPEELLGDTDDVA